QHQHDLLALVAKILGDCSRDERTTRANQRSLVASSDNYYGARESFLAKRVFDEVTHFSTALTEERDDVHVRLGVTCDHAEQRALADTGTREYSDALTAADGKHPVDRANARLQRLVDHATLQRVRRLGRQWNTVREFDRPLVIDRMAESVENATEQRWTDVDTERAAEGLHEASSVQAIELAERHQDDVVLVKSDDFGEHRSVVRQARDTAQLTDAHVDSRGLDDETNDSRDTTITIESRSLSDGACKSIKQHCRSACDKVARAPYRHVHPRSSRVP